MAKKWDRCTRCILSASFPKIEFDENGVCNFCRDRMLFTSEEKAVERARQKLEQLLQNKGQSAYHAVMCYSGGKDSTYTLKLAVEKYGLKVLAFTLDNGFIAPGAMQNIARVVDHLGVDLITYRPSAAFFHQLIKVSALKSIYNPITLVRVSSVCNSCVSLINITSLKIAMEKNIPLILAGFTLGQIPYNAIIYQNNYRFLQESRRPVLEKLKNYLGAAVDEYFSIQEAVLNRVAAYPYNVNLLCLETITEQEIVKNIEALGWKRPSDIDGCSSNCMLNTFNNFIHEKTFGYSPYELELSHLIRKGFLSREEALEKVLNQSPALAQQIMKQLGVTGEDIGNLKQHSEREG